MILVIEKWLVELLGDENYMIKHHTKNLALQAIIDSDRDYTINPESFNDPNWQFVGNDENGEPLIFEAPDGRKGPIIKFTKLKEPNPIKMD